MEERIIPTTTKRRLGSPAIDATWSSWENISNIKDKLIKNFKDTQTAIQKIFLIALRTKSKHGFVAFLD